MTTCTHGIVLTIPNDDHPVSRIITDFFTGATLKTVLKNYDELLLNDTYREMAVDILTVMGINSLIDWRNGEHAQSTVAIAIAILVFERCAEYEFDADLTMNGYYTASKLRDLHLELPQRDLLKFFRKRATCSCLKKMHLEARKTQPKLGRCYGCDDIKERALLMICSRCRIYQYCSRKCQVAASSRHRTLCDKYVDAHEKAMSNSTT